jgi:hypothetical protein
VGTYDVYDEAHETGRVCEDKRRRAAGVAAVDAPVAPGDERVDEIGGAAHAVSHEYRSVEELVCFAEHLRLFAGNRARKEEDRAAELRTA